MGNEMSVRSLLHSMTADEQALMPRANLLKLRRATYAEHVGEMPVSGSITRWVALMTALYPDGVKVWEHELPWADALMVVRYGEDTRHWPSEFSIGDEKRAKDWAGGKHPSGVQYPSNQSRTLVSLALMAVAGLGFAIAILADSGLGALVLLPMVGTAMTDYLENKLADHIFRTTTFTQPTILGVALYTAAPGETGGGTEVTGGSYARVANNPLNANWNGTHGNTTGVSSGTGGLVTNAGTITFPAPTANWGVVTHFGLLDNTSGGNLLIYGALTVSKTINNADPAPTFPATTLGFTFA